MRERHEENNDELFESNEDLQIYCAMYNKLFRTKIKLSHDMSANHKSYKPCDYFKEGKCDVNGKCRYNHEKRKPGQEICYKCELKFKSKGELLMQIEKVHGHKICHKYLENKCTDRRCLISHIMPYAANEDRNPQRKGISSTNTGGFSQPSHRQASGVEPSSGPGIQGPSDAPSVNISPGREKNKKKLQHIQ